MELGVPRRPKPIPDPISFAYWEAAKHGRLAIQRCRSCRRFAHPPVAMCPSCCSLDLGAEVVEGRGVIDSLTIVRSPIVVGFEDCVPFACVAVEIDDQKDL